jgi:hypothetical protein
MSGTIDDPRNEQLSWRANLDLTDLHRQTEPGEGPEDLLFQLRRSVAVYRFQVLPHLAAERDLVLPALIVEQQNDSVVTGYARILAEELAGLADRMETIQQDLLRFPHSEPVRTRVISLLTAAAALATVAMRFGGEVVLPQLSEELSPQHSEQLAEAVHAYERSYR